MMTKATTNIIRSMLAKMSPCEQKFISKERQAEERAGTTK